MATASGVPLRVLWGYSTATGYTAASITVASEYPHSTLKGTLTCSSHSGTALYETHIVGLRNLDVYSYFYALYILFWYSGGDFKTQLLGTGSNHKKWAVSSVNQRLSFEEIPYRFSISSFANSCFCMYSSLNTLVALCNSWKLSSRDRCVLLLAL